MGMKENKHVKHTVIIILRLPVHSKNNNNGGLATSHSGCLKDWTGLRVLPAKDPIGNNLSSLLLITFSKNSSQLIYTLFIFVKSWFEKKKKNHGCRIQRVSVKLMWVGLRYPDRLLVEMIFGTKKILRFRFLPRCCLWLVSFERWMGTYTCLLLGTDTCTQPLQKGGCWKRKSHGQQVWDVVCLLQGGCGKAGHGGGPSHSPLHEGHDVHEAGGADHGLVGEDGLHGLLHAVIGLQRGQERLDFFPGSYTFKRWNWEFTQNTEGWKYTSKHERWCYLSNRICNLFCSLRCAFTLFSKFSYCEHILFALSGKQVFFCLKRKAELVCFSVKWESCVFKMPWNVFQIIIFVFFQLKKREGVWHNKQ